MKISIFGCSPNKFYHSLFGSQIKTAVKSCHQSERQRNNQKDKESIVYKMNFARIKYLLLAWLGENLVGKGGIKWGRRNLPIFKSMLEHNIVYYIKLKLNRCFNLV